MCVCLFLFLFLLVISTLYRVRKTVYSMLTERGYLIGSEDLSMTLETFKEKYAETVSTSGREKLTILASKKDKPADQIFVFWADSSKLGIQPVKK